jgi:mRNA interferase MazF
MEIKQYQIVLINLDTTQGSEIKKPRPCLIISPNETNKYLQTIVVAPLTSTSKPYPTRVKVKHAKAESWIVLDQIRCVNRNMILRNFDFISPKEIAQVKSVFKETYVD